MANDTREDQGNYYPGGHVVVSGQGASGHPDITALAATVYQHTGNGVVHVTASDKAVWTAKQDALTASQKAAVNSGITAAKVADIPANYVKDATATSTKLTLTKSDGTTVEYRGGGGSGGGAVDSVNGKTGDVVLTATDIKRDEESTTTVQDALGDIELELCDKVDADDSRLTDSRTPTAHASSHATGGSDAITPGRIGAAAVVHTHTKNQITDFPQSMDPNAHASTHATGGSDAITPSSIGAIGNTGTQTIDATVDGQDGKLIINGGDGGGSLEVRSLHPDVIPASIKKNGKEVATEDFAKSFGLYPFYDVEGGAVLDRTSNQGDANTTSYTLPASRTDYAPRDFVLVIDLSGASDDVTITINPSTEETIQLRPADDSTFTLAKGKLNLLWFHEAIPGGTFAVRRAEF